MYWTTPSGTRYQTGSPRRLRSRQSVEEIASAGISTMVTWSDGIFSIVAGSIS